jgi:hypothetical protein
MFVVLTASVSLSGARYAEPGRRTEFIDTVLQRIERRVKRAAHRLMKEVCLRDQPNRCHVSSQPGGADRSVG